MRIGPITIFLFMFTTAMNVVKAQQQIFKNYTVNDGLISNEIRGIFQDSKGFLWIATLEGLSKYDGNTFTNFSSSNGLSQNMVNDLYESGDGGLYVALNNGSIDEIRDGKVIRGLVNESIVNRIFKTPWNQVIALTDKDGFKKFENGKLTQLSLHPIETSFFNAVVLSDTSFAATDIFFLRVFDKNYKELSRFRISDYAYYELKCQKDSRGRLWIALVKGIELVEPVLEGNKLVLRPNLPSAYNFLNGFVVNDIFEDEVHNMWFATTSGIVKVKSDGSHQIFTVKEGLTSNIVITIFQDKEKNIWFGTAVGLSKLVTQSGISVYPIENGISSNDRKFLMYPYKKGHFLVSTSNGTKDFNKSTGVFSTAFKKNDDNFYKAVINANPVIISGLNKSITIDTQLLQTHIIPAFSFPSNIRVEASDKKGNNFAIDFNNLYFISLHGLQKILNDRVSGLIVDSENNLWAGTWQHGLIRFQYKVLNDRIEILETKYFLPSISIRSLYEDSHHNIWAGTRYTGVFRINKNENGSFNLLNISQKDGLSSNFIRAIREDNKGNFWIAFFQGLDKLVLRNNKFEIFNFSRIHNYFASILGMEIDDSNILWLATREGIVRVKDNHLEDSPPLPVYITKIYASDTTFLIQSPLDFNYTQKNLAFEYSAPGYINEKQILYSYRLIGNNDEEWSKANNQHTVSFAGLQPGKYQFQVKSLGWNGIWSQTT
ncbi:MAG: two-component regulator propeller domain-containing protein, partial [Ginsengibacter sp.]